MNITPEGHIVKRFDGELHRLHVRVLEIGGLALAQVKDALRALRQKDMTLAHKIIGQRESEIDLLEIEMDAEILGLIARRSPLGGDLRFVMAVSKSVTDLERIGAHAQNLAEYVIFQIKGKDVRHQNGGSTV